jgi:hypothetical protein
MTGPTLQIQSVLYNNEAEHVERFINAIGRSVQLGVTAGAMGETTVVLGDCSPTPSLSDEHLTRMRAASLELGIAEIDYRFFGENLGSAAGHNQLFTTLTSDYVLIINPDTVAAPRLVEELFQPFTAQVSVGLVEARQLPFEHPKPYDPLTGETPWCTTACALAPREVVAEVGGFDNKSFFLYCDDVDWSWRIRLAGYRLIMRDSARIFHDKRLNDDGTWMVGHAEEYYSAEAALMMAHKWGRPDLVTKYSNDLRTYGSELKAKAVDVFESRRDEGTLPEPVHNAASVATFVDGVYAVHRF